MQDGEIGWDEKLEFAGLDALQIPVASSQWSVVSIR
jgi:hypothetical protein